MSLLARYFVEAPGNTIFAAHWNGEFDNILTNLDPQHIEGDSASLSAYQTTEDPGGLGTELLPLTLEGEIRRLRYVAQRIVGGTKKWYEAPLVALESLGTANADIIALKASVVPVGSIIPFYDFGSAGPGNTALTFNTSTWAFCDGSNANLTISGNVTAIVLPDLSNRYLVGFGTEGGGDIDTAAWGISAVGLAGHEANLAHTHTGPSHAHTVGTLKFRVAETGSSNPKLTFYDSGGVSRNAIVSTPLTIAAGAAMIASVDDSPNYDFYTKGGSGSVAAGGTGATGSGGSATQSVQPRSVRVRFIMRIA